jgi:hypothetical protein
MQKAYLVTNKRTYAVSTPKKVALNSCSIGLSFGCRAVFTRQYARIA